MVAVGAFCVDADLVTATSEGSEELQVSGGAEMMLPRLSVTTALTVWDSPCVKMIGLLLVPFTESVMDCTGQVMKLKGALFTPEILANVELRPGLPAVAWT
jgi:hypothetical protein